MSNSSLNPADGLLTAVKIAGFTARQVTVQYPHSTLYVTVRDASVSLTKVRAIAGAFVSICRDHMSGEILCGG